jgi:hypothetical protein
MLELEQEEQELELEQVLVLVPPHQSGTVLLELEQALESMSR